MRESSAISVSWQPDKGQNYWVILIKELPVFWFALLAGSTAMPQRLQWSRMSTSTIFAMERCSDSAACFNAPFRVGAILRVSVAVLVEVIESTDMTANVLHTAASRIDRPTVSGLAFALEGLQRDSVRAASDSDSLSQVRLQAIGDAPTSPSPTSPPRHPRFNQRHLILSRSTP